MLPLSEASEIKHGGANFFVKDLTLIPNEVGACLYLPRARGTNLWWLLGALLGPASAALPRSNPIGRTFLEFFASLHCFSLDVFHFSSNGYRMDSNTSLDYSG